MVTSFSYKHKSMFRTQKNAHDLFFTNYLFSKQKLLHPLFLFKKTILPIRGSYSFPNRGQDNLKGERWRPLIQMIMDNSPKAFERLWKKQRTDKNGDPFASVSSAISYINNQSDNSLGILLKELNPPLICFDVDNPQVGKRLKQIFNKEFSNIDPEKLLGNPIVIETERPNHVHLYYKKPDALIKKNQDPTHGTVLSRLGVPIEYIYNISVLAQNTRKILRLPEKLDEISEMPKILWPWNFQDRGKTSDDFDGNISMSRTGKHRTKGQGLIPKGRRYNTLFEWCNTHNFSFNEIQLLVYATCDDVNSFEETHMRNLAEMPSKKPSPYQKTGPIPGWDVYGEFKEKIPLETNLKQTVPSILDDTDTLNEEDSEDNTVEIEKTETSEYRRRDNEPTDPRDHMELFKMGVYSSKASARLFQSLRFSPFRAQEAVLKFMTNQNVMQIVATIELNENIFIMEDLWMGKSQETFLLNLLQSCDRLDVKVIYRETWYLWDKQIWQLASENDVLDYIYNNLKQVGIGSLEKNLIKGEYVKALKSLVFSQNWPLPQSGITFKNGTLILDEKNNPQLVPFEKDHNLTHHWNIDYDPNAQLTPADVRFILDICGHNVYNINIFRLCTFTSFFQGYSQFGLFLQGDPGSGKSIWSKLLQKYNPQNSATVDPKAFKKNSYQVHDLVVNKLLLFISDVSPRSISSETVEFIKNILGRDLLIAEQKFGKITNFYSYAFLIIVSNFFFSNIKEFSDPAVYSRLIQFTVPAIKSEHKIANLENLLLKNPSGLLNWAFNISGDFVKNTIRADDVNQVVSVVTDPIEFFFNQQVYESDGNRISNQDIYQKFVMFTENSSIFKEEFESFNLEKCQLRTFLKGFKKILAKYQNPTIKAFHTNEERGFENLNILSYHEKKDDTFKFSFDEKESPALKYLRMDPFKYHGLLFLTNKKALVQTKLTNRYLEIAAKTTVRAVYKSSMVNLLKPFSVDQFFLHDHLYINQTQKGIPVHDFYKYKDSELCFWNYNVDISSPLDKNYIQIFDSSKPSFDFDSAIEQEEINLALYNDFLTPDPPYEAEIEIIDDSLQNNENESPKSENFENENITMFDRGEQFPTNVDPSDLGLITESEYLDSIKDDEINQSKTTTFFSPFAKITEQEVVDSNTDLLYFRQNLKEILKVKVIDKVEFSEKFDHCCYHLYNWRNQYTGKAPYFFVVPPQYKTFESPYSGAKNYEELFEKALLSLPHTMWDITFFFNKYYYQIIEVHSKIVSLRKRSNEELFYQKIPGNSENIKKESMEMMEPHFDSDSSDHFLSTEGWNGASIFPLHYSFYDKHYQRLKTCPSVTISKINKIFKNELLSAISQEFECFFIELDIKSCHTAIFYSLSEQYNEIDQSSLPDINNMWSILEKEFRDIYKEKQKDKKKNTFTDLIDGWSSETVKSLLKKIWYKLLNAGSLSSNQEIFKNSYKELGVGQYQASNLERHLASVFEQMKSFKSLLSFKDVVNKNKFIHLPTKTEPFDTQTKSSNEEKKLLESESGSGMTGMSRLFASCEIVLIFLLIENLCTITSSETLLPISYESDGLLVMGKVKERHLKQDHFNKLMNNINYLFNQQCQIFMPGDFKVTAKQIWYSDKIRFSVW